MHHHTHREDCHGGRGQRRGERFVRGEHRHAGAGHDHDRHGRGGGRRQGRVFDHGELRFVVLALIAERPRHGYEIIKAIEDRLAGTYSPSPGVIYPTLTMLDELGHATVAEAEGKKLYAITEAGTDYLTANRVAVDAALGRMVAVREAHGGGPAPALIRAMENLKLALRLRQAQGPLTEDQVRSIAAALDTAAIAVERS